MKKQENSKGKDIQTRFDLCYICFILSFKNKYSFPIYSLF